jgi:hypothetical protein
VRFFSFGTDFKYALDRIVHQEIYTDAPDGIQKLAFIVEATPATSDESPSAVLCSDNDGRLVISMPAATLDYEVIIQACHLWMAAQGISEQPVWFLALPPGKRPEEFLTF